MISQDAQLIAQAREAHARAMKCSDLAHEGAWMAREGWHEPAGSNYWHVTATRTPTKYAVEPYEVSKAFVRDPDVAALLTFMSTGLPRLLELADAGRAALEQGS